MHLTMSRFTLLKCKHLVFHICKLQVVSYLISIWIIRTSNIVGRDVDGISRSRDIPRLSRDQNIPGVRIPGVWLSRNPGIFNPRILNPGKSRNKISRDFLFPKIPECFKKVPGYPGIFFFLFPNKFAFVLCLVKVKVHYGLVKWIQRSYILQVYVTELYKSRAV